MEGQFNARISRLERMQDSETEIPKPTAADAGKVVTVNEDGDGYVLGEGGGGGSGLPAYSSSDIGKVLTLGEGSSFTTEIIVTEQTVTVEGGALAPLSGVNEDYFTNGYVNKTARLTVNGNTETATLLTNNGVYAWVSATYAIPLLTNSQYGRVFLSGANGQLSDGSYTVSLIYSVPSAEPKWEAAGGGTSIHVVKAVGDVTVRVDGNEHYATMQGDANPQTIEEWLNSGEPVFCVAPTVTYESGGSYSYTNASMAIVMSMHDVDMIANSPARALTFYPSNSIFEWYFANIN